MLPYLEVVTTSPPKMICVPDVLAFLWHNLSDGLGGTLMLVDLRSLQEEERALQVGGTIIFCRPELHLESRDAINVPVSTDTYPTAVIPIAHETMCLQNIRAHFGFCLCIAKGQKASGRAQPTSLQEVLPPFSAKPPKQPLFHLHLYVRNRSSTPYNHNANVKWD